MWTSSVLSASRSLTRRPCRVAQGYSGVAYYNAWLSTGLASTNNNWVSTCTSIDAGANYYTIDVNGATISGWLLSMQPPDALSINGNVYVDQEWSSFGVAELMTWDRALTNAEIREVQTYLTSKYGLANHVPPAPPAPAAPAAAPAPLAASLNNGLMTWYNLNGWTQAQQLPLQPMSQESGTWKSQLNGNTVALSLIDVVTDAPGVAGNSVPIMYVSGAYDTSIIFPEVYTGLTQMSICSVTRYTSAFGAYRARILQPFRSQSNWLHGQWNGQSGVAYYNGWLSMTLSTTATKWVATCSAYDINAGTYTLDVNGHPVSGSIASMVVPDQLTVNGNVYVDQEWSAFGVAELMVWNRVLSLTELTEAQAALLHGQRRTG